MDYPSIINTLTKGMSEEHAERVKRAYQLGLSENQWEYTTPQELIDRVKDIIHCHACDEYRKELQRFVDTWSNDLEGLKDVLHEHTLGNVIKLTPLAYVDDDVFTIIDGAVADSFVEFLKSAELL